MLPFGLTLWSLLLILLGIIIVASLLGLLLGQVMPSSRSSTALDSERLNSNKWGRWKTVRKDLGDDPEPDPRRLWIGQLEGHDLANPPLRSVMVMAPSGAGKTPRYVVRAVLRHHGPAVVTSVKGDLLELTRAHREQQGPVWVFDPSGTLGQATWSPLAHITTWADALDAARWIQESSKADATGGLKNSEFWDAQARFLLAPLMFLAAKNGRHMGDVANLVVGGRANEDFVTHELDQLEETQASTYWARFVELVHETKSSVLATAATILEGWTHPRIAAAVNVFADDPNLLNLDELLSTNGTLYLVSPATEQSRFTPIYECLVNAITMRVEHRYMERGSIALDPPILLALDEAANIAPLRRLDYLASAGAGQGILLVSVWQDEGQIESIYNRAKARTIISNHYTKVYLPGISDHETLVHLSDQIGQDLMKQTSHSAHKDGSSTTTSWVEKPVAPAWWLRQLPQDQAIILAGRHSPILGRLPAWFEDDALRALIPTDVAERFDKAHSRLPATKGRKR
ncbi:MAG: type IV secretory system conjugative DNA transfer family protein [Propionibacteriaceae bacterium]|nr:type IV secretory system conjugative DNA transfer family protein [Propionibacteriaceae bacterium]